MKKLVLIASIFAITQGASAATYKIDSDHTTVGFKIKHLAISTVTGKFTDFSGTFDFDPKNIAASKATAEVKIPSINTEVKKRDDHLKGPDFFDAAKYPDISFKTNKVESVQGTTFKASGDLTIHGVTKPVTLDVEFGGEAKDPWGNERAAFTASTKIKRSDFGLTWNKTLETGGLLVGDDVTISLEVEGIKQKA